MAESWGGAYWMLGSPLNPIAATQSFLYAVSCPGVAVCTAVDSRGSWTPANRDAQVYPLAERYS